YRAVRRHDLSPHPLRLPGHSQIRLNRECPATLFRDCRGHLVRGLAVTTVGERHPVFARQPAHDAAPESAGAAGDQCQRLRHAASPDASANSACPRSATVPSPVTTSTANDSPSPGVAVTVTV